MSNQSFKYFHLYLTHKTNGKTEPSTRKQEPEMEQKSQCLCVTKSLFFFHSQRPIFKMEGWLQNSFSISLVTQKAAPNISNFCLSNIACSCLMLEACLLCFIPNSSLVNNTQQHVSIIWATGLTVIQQCLRRTLDVPKWSDKTPALFLLRISALTTFTNSLFLII